MRKPLLCSQPAASEVSMPSRISCLVPRGVSPSPQTFSRGNRLFSNSETRKPWRARWVAVAEPAGPAPTTITSASITGSFERAPWSDSAYEPSPFDVSDMASPAVSRDLVKNFTKSSSTSLRLSPTCRLVGCKHTPVELHLNPVRSSGGFRHYRRCVNLDRPDGCGSSQQDGWPGSNGLRRAPRSAASPDRSPVRRTGGHEPDDRHRGRPQHQQDRRVPAAQRRHLPR